MEGGTEEKQANSELLLLLLLLLLTLSGKGSRESTTPTKYAVTNSKRVRWTALGATGLMSLKQNMCALLNKRGSCGFTNLNCRYSNILILSG